MEARRAGHGGLEARAALPRYACPNAKAAMSVPGQNRISSLRGYVFCFAPESGQRALQSACLFRATSGLMHRRPSHRQAIGDEQCQAVSDDLRLAAQPSRVMRPQGPELRLFPVPTFHANMVFADVVCR